MEGNVSNPKLTDAQRNLVGASLLVQNYVEAITEQKDITTLTEMPSLPKHQQTAREHGAKWKETVLPGIIMTIADTIDFANRFSSYYDSLVMLADQVATDSTARDNFITELSRLAKSVSEKSNNTKQTLVQIQVFHKDLESDYKIFREDHENAIKIYQSKGGNIDTLNKEIEDALNQFYAGIAALVGGVVTTGVGICLIVVGAIAELPTEGASTSVVLAGIGLIATGGAVSFGGLVDASALGDKLRKLREKLKEDQEGLDTLGTVKSTLDHFVDENVKANGALDQLSLQWSNLEDSMNKLLSDLKTNPGTTGPQLKAMIDQAKQDWDEALKVAKQLQPNGQVSVKKVKNLSDVK